MENHLRKVFFLSLIGIMLFCCGCATFQKLKRAEELEKELIQLNQLIKERESQIEEKDNQINQLQKLLNEKEEELKEHLIFHKQTTEQLYKELEGYKARLREAEQRIKLK
ncbi:MAG: hypothetical protein NC912_03435 [Candidatus Omnitrophica bacterium]|nr:hypothetical protein [Candidatus Omnitrophota bacterium]